MVDWSVYLRSICDCKKYACWWDVYTLTDVVGQKRVATEASPLVWDFGLMVQTVQAEKPGSEEQKTELTKEQKTERLDVLEGLRKYAKDHLLLIGKPGSGKSTALVRLLLEEAQKAQQETQAKIPVLVELRYYQTSVMDLIRDFLKRHGVLIQSSEIETLLLEGKLLLLIDGVNELPSEEARRNLKAFEQNHPTTPMVFTTRELQVGGDLSITKKLEMQALTEPQMREFVKKYLPGKGEQLLRQLGTRLREFGQTPLLLSMLCSVFSNSGSVPPNLGLVFRSFSESYENKIQQDVPTKDESREWWHRLLRHLAFTMIQGKEQTELQVAIPKEDAETTLTRFLENERYHQPHNALSWLNDLVKYHLIQIANDQIEFCHQLIQEYYAAENLLELLPKLSDEELKWGYLNYLKWTEPLALMLALVDSQEQAVRVVKLAIEVDWQLGARLAGEVKSWFHEATVSLVTNLDVPLLAKTQLWSLTHSEKAVLELMKALTDEESYVRSYAAYALGKIGSNTAVNALITALTDEESYVRSYAADALGKIGSNTAINALITALTDKESYVRINAADALGKIGSDTAINALITALTDKESYVRINAADALSKIGSNTAVNALITALTDKEPDVRINAAYALVKIGSDTAVNALITALTDRNSDVRKAAADALVKIGSETTVNALITALTDEESYVRINAADALGEIGSDTAVNALITALTDRNSDVRKAAADALVKIGSETTVNALITALTDEDSYVRSYAADVLVKIGSNDAINALITALTDEDSYVRSYAADALGKIGSDTAVNALITALTDEDSYVRINAAYALGKIGSDTAVNALITALTDEDSYVRINAADALGKIGLLDAAVNALITALIDDDSHVRWNAAYALGEIGSDAAVNALITALTDDDSDVRKAAAYALGNIGSDTAVNALITALTDWNSDVRINGAYALVKIGSDDAINALITALTDEESYVRINAAEALVKIDSDAAVNALITALINEELDVLWKAAEALVKIDSDAAINALITALTDGNSDVRWKAAEALVKIGSDAAVNALITVLTDEGSNVTRKAAEALVKMGSDAAVNALITVLINEESNVRWKAAYALGEIGSDAAVNALTTALTDGNSDVRWKAAEALVKIGSDAAVNALITALTDGNSHVRSKAAEALGKIGSDAAINALITALTDEESYVRSKAAEALGEIGSDAAINALITALTDEGSNVRINAADALGKFGSDAAVNALITALTDENSYVRRNAAEALDKTAKIQVISQLKEIISNSLDLNLLNAIATIQERHKYYQEIPQTTAKPLPITHISFTPMHILHLSDLHFGTPKQANLWSGQLAEDLLQELGISHLEALILSGDIANKSTPEEYAAAKLFLDEFCQDFPLNPDQIVIVPGNHDLNWTICEEDAYKPVLRKKYKGPVDEHHVIDDGSQYLAVLDEQEYQRRFEYFSNFYQAIKETPYPLKYEQQYTLETIGNLLILGLNSAWQLDHHYKNRATINNDALSNALKEISRNEAYKNSPLKMAVWHHPINSPYEDRIKNSDFLGRLPINEFQLFLHGHVHKADNDRFYYDSVEDGRKLHRICAGTFGAPTKELVTATPWQYNLLILEGDEITVKTRKRESENGPWESDARWRQGAGQPSLDSYTIKLSPKSEAV